MYVIEVIPKVYQITIKYSNIYLIAEESLTLIDTGFRGSSPSVIKFIESLGRTVDELELIILTHNHIDHGGGLPEWKEITKAKAAAHRVDLPVGDDTILYPDGSYIGKLLKVPVLSGIKKRFVFQPEDIDIVLDGGEVFPVLGGLQVIHTPGHTSGCISLYASREKMIFVGDALNNRQNILRPPVKRVSLDVDQGIESIKTMSGLDIEIVCTGHGKPVTEGAKDKLLGLLEKYENQNEQER